jgi:serine/threonine protein kinase
MGEVYRARDTKLNRDVALKILPDAFAADPDRLLRFKREAQVLASLNHSNIAIIHGLEETDDGRALVLELVEGETLADRIARGPIPFDEALSIAEQLAEALEAAHDQGIFHRDLKPANIKLRPDGTVKLLDFGLAKALDPAPTPNDISESPTFTSPPMTRMGLVLGTPAYMSPEQARGQAVDKRTDIWAFGCVLYEMLAGRRIFEGESPTDTLALVFTKDPEWSALPPQAPPVIRALLKRCLERDRVKRLGDVAAIRFALEDVAGLSATDQATTVLTSTKSSAWPIRMAWLGGGLLAGVSLASLVLRSLAGPPAPLPEMWLQLTTPATSAPLQFSLSPDGKHLVFVASGDGPLRLWLRPLAEAEAHPIAGTEGARYPFWSSDSRSIGFFMPGALYRVSISGGSPTRLADAPGGVGGTWNADDTILFAGASSFPLSRVAASGGAPSPLTHLSEGQAGHRFPYFLPDGRRFLFYASGDPGQSGIYLGALDGGTPKRLTAADSAGAFLAPDWIVFTQQGSLIARRLDLSSVELTGDPVTLTRAGTETNGLGGFSVSAARHVAFRGGDVQRSQLVWRNRMGRLLGSAAEPDANNSSFPELSPDGRFVAARRTYQTNMDVWLLDLLRVGWTRFTNDPGNDQLPVWSPDGKRIAFSSNRAGRNNLYAKTTTAGGGEELLLDTPYNKQPQGWSADGRFLLYYEIDPKTGRDLWLLDTTSGDKRVIANTSADERAGQISPNGQWVAYESDQSGRFEIVVRAFPPPAAMWPVSTGGGAQPRWSWDGREIYFISPDLTLMAARVGHAPGQVKDRPLVVGRPEPLFPVHIVGGTLTEFVKAQYAVSRDGRFLMNEPVGEPAAVPITLILNWNPERRAGN